MSLAARSGARALLLILATQAAPALTAPIIANNRMIQHPRMIFDASMLSNLRARAQANSPEWTALKTRCDVLAGMRVLFFDENGSGLGEGYQGGEYYNALMSLGLCRQVLLTGDSISANRYGRRMVEILQKMSDPKRSPWPGRDNGYGIRFYGIGMAYGYDWAYDLLDTATKSQLWKAMNRWIAIVETDPCCDWEWAHPNSNYFASYYHAKAAAAIATEGDNRNALAMWEDWIHNQHEGRVQPFFASNLAGGGWPEGFPNYGPLAVLNHSLATLSVFTAKGIDLIHASQPYEFPFDTGDYLMQFTWPSLTYTDDRGAAHAVKAGERAAGMINPTMFTSVAGILHYWQAPEAAVFQQYAEDVRRQANKVARDSWQEFLLWDPHAAKAPVSSLPRSYVARGLNHVAARSDWSRAATWLSFVAGTYINNPSQGEQGFDEGSVTLVRGGTPLLVNAATWLMHNTPGTQDGEITEKAVYRANYGNFKLDAAAGNRDIYSIFYVRHLDSEGVPIEPYGQAALGPSEAATHISQFEDGDRYVLARGSKLEDMYSRPSATKLVQSWTRQLLYLRPSQVIVYDQTVSGDKGFDQFMAWSFPARPAGHGMNRLDINYASTFAGSMIQVLPAGARMSSTNVFHADKVWREEVRPAANDVRQRWLTVFDLSSSPENVAAVTSIAIRGSEAHGVLLDSGLTHSVVVFGELESDRSGSNHIVYRVPAARTRHLIANLAPDARYGVEVSVAGGQHVLTISRDGALTTTPAGVLSFQVNASGAIER